MAERDAEAERSGSVETRDALDTVVGRARHSGGNTPAVRRPHRGNTERERTAATERRVLRSDAQDAAAHADDAEPGPGLGQEPRPGKSVQADSPNTRTEHGISGSLIDKIVASARARMGAGDYERYFAGQSGFAISANVLEVTVGSEFLIRFLSKRCGEALREAARAESGGAIDTVRFLEDRDAAGSGAPETPSDAVVGGSRTAHEPGAGVGLSDSAGQHGANHAAGNAVVVRVGRTPRRASLTTTGGTLRHRLEDFVVGNCNRLAYSAALRIADQAGGDRFSPLFIHGSCGLGKTHLLQGIAERFARSHPGAQVRYTTGEGFTNEFLAAMRSGQTESFRKAYRRLDMLCIDDVHFFSAKEATQSELMHTFDTIDFDGARVVLASDEHPREIKRLSDRLTSRFLSGMVVKIDTPDTETRVRLVKHIAARRNLPLDEPAAQLIAERSARSLGSLGGFGGSVREIEGIITQVEAIFRLLPEIASSEGSAGLNLVRRALGLGDAEASRSGQSLRNRRPVQVREIAAEVCRTLRVDMPELLGRGRHARVVLARSVTALLSRRMTTMSFPEIARAMARPNHSTVITACKRMTAGIKAGHPLAADLDLGGDLAGMTLGELCDHIARRVERESETA